MHKPTSIKDILTRWHSVPLLVCAAFVSAGCASTAAESTNQSKGVQIQKLEDRLRVNIDGQLFTEYYFKDVPRPFCYPLNGPSGLGMTRNWPMKDVPGEEHDHPHHRSFWFAHGAVNGHDFWTERTNTGKIVHVGFDKVESGKDTGVIKTRNNWVAADGTIVCTDEETLRIYDRGDNERLFDFEITIHASNGEVTMGDTKEGTMATRVAESMRLKVPVKIGEKPLKPGDGHIVNSESQRDDDCWGKRAEWCDYYGPVQGKTVGLAIFDHPQNIQHPGWWMARDYGYFGLNHFGKHEFEKLEDKHAGDYVIRAGKSLTLRYRFLLHEGDEKQGKVAEHFKEFVQSSGSSAK